jgi:hypothetical protein
MPITAALVYLDQVRARAVVLMLGLAGCDLVFPPGAGPGPGAADADPDDVIDALIDAADRAYDADLSHNEDGDQLLDFEDPCPHLAGDAADRDSDGVGDLCDPQPEVNRQRIAYFNGFAGGLDGLVAVGDVTLEPDEVLLRGHTGDTATLYLPGTHAVVDVHTHFVVESVPPALISEVMAIAGHTGSGSTVYGASCRLGRTGPMIPEVVFYELHHQTGAGSDLTLADTTFLGTLTGLSGTLHLSFDNAIDRAACDYNSLVIGADPALDSDGTVGVAVRRLDARFAYLLVIASD